MTPALTPLDRKSNPATAAAGGAGQPGSGSLGVLVNHVGVGLFDVFDVPILAGRGFVDADTREGSTAVVVDRTLADRIAGGANVVGRRIRYVGRGGQPDPERDSWYEIVGVVPAFPAPMLPDAFNEVERKLFHPVAPVQAGATMVIVRVRGRQAAGFTGPVRDITAAVDPALQLHELTTARESRRVLQQALRLSALGILRVTGSVLLLSAAEIYAMMSFTVARRRREIGIRAALSADPRRILSGIFARAAAQLGAGVAIGLVLAVVLEWGSDGWVMGGRASIVLPAVTALIMAVGLLAALGPARRGLAVQPTEALREE